MSNRDNPILKILGPPNPKLLPTGLSVMFCDEGALYVCKQYRQSL